MRFRKSTFFAVTAMLIVPLSACQHAQSEPQVSQSTYTGLAGTSWRLVEFKSMDDAQGTTRPDDPEKYTITFNKDGSLAARLDCNRGMGPWRNDVLETSGGSLVIGPLAVTKALCPPPSMGEMLERNLGFVRSFIIEGGRLHMALMADGGIIVWEPVKPN